MGWTDRNPDAADRDPDAPDRDPDAARWTGMVWLAAAWWALAPAILPAMGDETLVIDQIEGRAARLQGDDGAVWTLPRRWLPDGAAEGDVLRVERRGDDTLRLRIDAAETTRRRADRQRRLDAITEDPPDDFHI